MFKYLLLASLLCFFAWTTAVDDDSHALVEKIFKHDDGNGHFAYGYDITNGIGADEAGDPSEVHGEFHFTTKEGKPIWVNYVADATGFHPQGDVLPTAPPTPAAILKALEYIRSHPKYDGDKKKH